MEQYLKDLIEQYKLATGIKSIDLQSEEFVTDFTAWLNERQQIAKNYAYFLDAMELHFAYADCAEIGKGGYDTIVKPFKTMLITPASQSLPDSEFQNRVINGNVRISGNKPILVKQVLGKNQYKEIPRDIISTYITQNPAKASYIFGWENLHNTYRNRIIVGVYGNIYDKNREAKLKLIKDFKAKLNEGNLIDDYTTMGDNYFYAVGTDVEERKLERIRIKTDYDRESR